MKNTCLVSVSVVLFTLSYIPFELSFLIYVAFVPFYVVMEHSRNLNYIVIYSFMVTFSMLFFVLFMEDIDLLTRIAFFNIILLWVISFLLVFCLLFCRLKKNLWINSMLLAGVWVSLDLLSQKMFNFSWFLYLTQYKQGIILWSGKLFGVYFITFLIIWCNYIIYRLLVQKKWVFLGIIFIGVLFGTYYDIPPTYTGEEVKVWVVQPCLSVHEKAKIPNGQQEQDLSFYSLFDKDAFKGHEIDFIVWPETVTNLYLMRIPDYREYLLQLSSETGAYLVIGSRDLDPELKEYNAVFIISPDGTIERYAKINTVPIIENNFTPGNVNLQCSTKYGKIDFLICWESLNFLTASSSHLTFLLTSNLSMGKTYAPIGHSLLGVFNAISRNSAVIVASYTGPSMLIDRQGRIHASAPIFRPYILKSQVPVAKAIEHEYTIPITVYYSLFVLAFLLSGKQKGRLGFKRINLVMLILVVILPLCIVKTNSTKVDHLYRKVPPQPQLYSTKSLHQIKPYDLTGEKKLIRDLLQFYGIWLEKYFTLDEVLTLDSEDILLRIGWELVPISTEISEFRVTVLLMEDENGWRLVEQGTVEKLGELARYFTVRPIAQCYDQF